MRAQCLLFGATFSIRKRRPQWSVEVRHQLDTPDLQDGCLVLFGKGFRRHMFIDIHLEHCDCAQRQLALFIRHLHIRKLEKSRFSHMTFMNTLQYYIAPTTVCNLLDAHCTIDTILITG